MHFYSRWLASFMLLFTLGVLLFFPISVVAVDDWTSSTVADVQNQTPPCERQIPRDEAAIKNGDLRTTLDEQEKVQAARTPPWYGLFVIDDNLAWFCQEDVWNDVDNKESAGLIIGPAIQIVVGLLTMISNLVVWLAGLFGIFIASLLSIGQYITHPFVAKGWPFILGVANLGFLLALLGIAAATTLRLEVGGGVRRLLPRLLIAALMINFSLVIGGILIDMSRVTMGVLVNILAQKDDFDFDDLGFEILRSSNQVTAAFNDSTIGFGALEIDGSDIVGDWAEILQALNGLFFVTILTIALAVVFTMLLIRYIMLLLLLVSSPFAYLAVAVPGAQSLAKKWWNQFLKWVMYGPIVMFVLVLLIGLSQTSVSLLASNAFLAVFMSTFLTIGMLVAAVIAGKSLGAAGSGLALGIATGAGNKARQLGKAGAKGAVKAAYVGTGTRSVVRNTRDAAKEFTKPIRRTFRMGEYSKYDKKGNLKKGEESLGSKAGKKASGAAGAIAGAAAGTAVGSVVGSFGGPVGAIAGGIAGAKLVGRKGRAEKKREQAQAQAARTALGAASAALATRGMTPNYNVPALNPSRLSQPHVLKGVQEADLDIMVRNTTDVEQIKAVAGNKDYWRDLDDQKKLNLQEALEANAHINAPGNQRDRADVLKRISDTLSDLEKERNKEDK